MPGEKIDREVERKCYPPVRVSNTVVQTQTEETEGDWSGTTTSTSTSVTVASSFRALSSESFNLQAARFDPATAAANPSFFQTYDPYNPTTYTKNTSNSEIEPKRMGSGLAAFEVTSPQETVTQTETTTVTRVVVRERPIAQQQSFDGDGDGDN